ncbi:MAG: ferrous iron transport protein A [Clostridiales bacterium]|nr:ferrous iron transport protein A [Candidatus Equinaster intestinalis]
MKLTNAALGEEYTVCCVSDNHDMKRRFSDLGIMKGETITPLYRSPFGEPTAYEILGAVMALRKEDSDSITVEKSDKKWD